MFALPSISLDISSLSDKTCERHLNQDHKPPFSQIITKPEKMSNIRQRPHRVRALMGIGVDQMGQYADNQKSKQQQRQGVVDEEILRLENLDVNIAPDAIVQQITSAAISNDDDNSYLPFLGQHELRRVVAEHVSSMTGGAVKYDGSQNCVICTGGLSGILNVLLATVDEGYGVVMTDPTYAGLINRVKLAGGVPVFAPLVFNAGKSWTLDHDQFRALFASQSTKITAMLMMSPNMPTGAYFTKEDWQLIAGTCVEHDLLLILDAAMERLLFDNRPVIHPASLPGMAERTITVGSASKELRMIGWRVGWICGPAQIMNDVAHVAMANVVVPVGIAQRAAKEALEVSRTTMKAYVQELEDRRNLCMRELEGLPFGRCDGGWSLLLRVDGLGWSASNAAKELFSAGICVTPMIGWGAESEAQYIRIVFSNESKQRLEGLGGRIRKALVDNNAPKS